MIYRNIASNIFEQTFSSRKVTSLNEFLNLDLFDKLHYAIPSKAVGGGNSSTAMNVFRVSFSQALSAAPQYQAWDNGSTYPAVDASGSTTVKEAFTGTTGNSSKPEYALIDTTSAAPSSNWLPSSASAGSANPNRLKGSTNYVTSPVTPAPASAPGSFTVADHGSGSGPTAGVYKYTITFVVGTTNPLGETLPSAEQSVTCISGHSLDLSSIPTGPAGTLYRNIYRTQSGGASNSEKFVHQIADNTTTTYTDSSSDASISSNAAQPTTDTSGSIRFNMTAEFASDSTVPSTSAQNILLEVLYQYTGSAPSLSYWYNDGGSDSVPTWTQLTPGTHGIRFVNTGTSSGTYKFTLPSSGTANVGELWVTTN